MECYIRGRGKLKSIKEFKLKDGRIIGVFQGSRGDNPDLDIIVKYKEPGKQVRTPQHIHWAIDLLIKREHNKNLVNKFIRYLLDVWKKVEPFKTKEDQQKCELKFTNPENLKEFEELNNYGEYSVEFIGHILELIMIQEKTGSIKAHMFKDTLEAILNNKDIFSIVSKATFRGR
ncbi:MAG: hypothetical protein ACTSW3_02110 [Promethearchaeota archaeon]